MVGYSDDLNVSERIALIRVREGTCQGLRQVAKAVRPGPGGWDELDIDFTDPARLAGWVVGFAADAEVIGPPDARDAVICRLKGALL
ncbi:WYL domain-containing protein [Streptosporangium lutulentum]